MYENIIIFLKTEIRVYNNCRAPVIPVIYELRQMLIFSHHNSVNRKNDTV